MGQTAAAAPAKRKTRTSTPTRVRFAAPTHHPEVPGSGLLRAASLCLALTAYARVPSVSDLFDLLAHAPEIETSPEEATTQEAWAQIDSPESGSLIEASLLRLREVDLDERDIDLLDEHAEILAMLHVTPLVTVAVCQTCGEWILLHGNPPSGCTLSRGCRGKLTKASKAPRAKETKAVEPDLAECVDDALDETVSAGEDAEVTLQVQTAAGVNVRVGLTVHHDSVEADPAAELAFA